MTQPSPTGTAPPHLTDADLVVRVQGGDDDAFGELVKRYLRLGGSVAYQVLGDYERAADAVQDAFLKVHRSIAGLREPARFKSWFYGVCRTVSIDRLRRDRRRAGPLSELAEAELAEVTDPLLGLEDEERRETVRAAVNELADGYREVIVLKYLDGRSYQEMAELLETSVEAVEARLHRARKKLKGKLMGFARKSGLFSPDRS